MKIDETGHSGLIISDLTVSYGHIPALHQISLTVQPGEIVTLLGSNGAGKTTTLRAISGLLPYQGRITYNHQDLSKILPHQRIDWGIAHVPEGRGIFKDLTVAENLRLAGWGRKKLDYELIDDLFPLLYQRRKQLAVTLSGGEQQMLAIARALLQQPRLLLLDEPSMGLAPKLILSVFAALKKIHDRGDVSILLIEQNAHLALDFAERAYVLENGAIQLVGKASDLRQAANIKDFYLAGHSAM